MKRPKYLQILHILGLLLVIAGAIIGGLGNAGIGFYIVVALLVIGIEIPNLPPVKKHLAPFIIGSVRYGGIKRGAAINWGFTLAIIYLAVRSFGMGLQMAAYSYILFAVGLAISTIALEVYMGLLKKFYTH